MYRPSKSVMQWAPLPCTLVLETNSTVSEIELLTCTYGRRVTIKKSSFYFVVEQVFVILGMLVLVESSILYMQKEGPDFHLKSSLCTSVQARDMGTQSTIQVSWIALWEYDTFPVIINLEIRHCIDVSYCTLRLKRNNFRAVKTYCIVSYELSYLNPFLCPYTTAHLFTTCVK